MNKKKLVLQMEDTLYAVREKNETTFFRECPRYTVDGYDGIVAFTDDANYHKELAEDCVYLVKMNYNLIKSPQV